MKNIFTLLSLFSFTSIFAIDRFVDPNLSSGNGTTLFTNITAAVATAVNGDRIIIAPGQYNEATLTISKSLTILPQNPGSYIVLNANVIVSGFPGMKLEILGFILPSNYSFLSNNIPNGIQSNRAKVSLINCQAYDINISSNYYNLNCINNSVFRFVRFKFGTVVKTTASGVFLSDEPQAVSSNEKILIVANSISKICSIHNNNNNVVVANNYLKDLFVTKWCQSNNVINKIFNNEFSVNSRLHFSSLQNVNTSSDTYIYNPVVNYNFHFFNNKFNGVPMFSQHNGATNNINYYSFDTDSMHSSGDEVAYFFYNNYTDPTSFFNCFYFFQQVSGCGTAWTTSAGWPNLNSSGFFRWEYNSLLHPYQGQASNLSFSNISGVPNDVDGGSPNHEYYDIDLTVNDRGVNGGPYSQINYNAANPNNSKAFIFDLDIPSDLFPGQNVNIVAKGYHNN
jgi:hypothetical protein